MSEFYLKPFMWRKKPDKYTDSSELTKDEIEEVMAIFNKDREAVTADDWENNFEAVIFLSAEAFCYFLPNIIKCSIDENTPNLLVVSSVINCLDRNQSVEMWDDFFVRRWTLLTVEECKVIQEWILWLSSLSNSVDFDESLGRAFDTVELLILRNEVMALD